jgi:hypothetical protein
MKNKKTSVSFVCGHFYLNEGLITPSYAVALYRQNAAEFTNYAVERIQLITDHEA